jgi:hypothetical protein
LPASTNFPETRYTAAFGGARVANRIVQTVPVNVCWPASNGVSEIKFRTRLPLMPSMTSVTKPFCFKLNEIGIGARGFVDETFVDESGLFTGAA